MKFANSTEQLRDFFKLLVQINESDRLFSESKFLPCWLIGLIQCHDYAEVADIIVPANLNFEYERAPCITKKQRNEEEKFNMLKSMQSNKTYANSLAAIGRNRNEIDFVSIVSFVVADLYLHRNDRYPKKNLTSILHKATPYNSAKQQKSLIKQLIAAAKQEARDYGHESLNHLTLRKLANFLNDNPINNVINIQATRSPNSVNAIEAIEEFSSIMTQAQIEARKLIAIEQAKQERAELAELNKLSPEDREKALIEREAQSRQVFRP